MATIPLYRTPATPDGWHQVQSPGGYEWWHFDAESSDGRIRMVANFFDGDFLQPKYIQRYRAYRRTPTRAVPPIPAEFPGAEISFYRENRLVQRFGLSSASGAFKVSTDGRELALGTSGFIHEGSQLRLHVAPSPRFEADLLFEPVHVHPACESRVQVAGAEHVWIASSPLSRVSGSIVADGQQTSFDGIGYRDQRFGTAPPGWAATRWMRGRIIFDDAVCAFWLVSPDSGAPPQARLIEAEANGARETSAAPIMNGGALKTPDGLEYSERLSFDQVLHLTNPTIIDSSGGRIQLIYAADYQSRRGSAVCEITSPET